MPAAAMYYWLRMSDCRYAIEEELEQKLDVRFI